MIVDANGMIGVSHIGIINAKKFINILKSLTYY